MPCELMSTGDGPDNLHVIGAGRSSAQTTMAGCFVKTALTPDGTINEPEIGWPPT